MVASRGTVVLEGLPRQDAVCGKCVFIEGLLDAYKVQSVLHRIRWQMTIPMVQIQMRENLNC